MITRVSIVAVLLASAPAVADKRGPFDKLAKVMRHAHESGDLRATCTISVHPHRMDLHVPLRLVTWSVQMMDDSSTTKSPVARATCRKADGKGCIGGMSESHTTDIPHMSWQDPISFAGYALRVASTRRGTEQIVRELNAFAKAHCAP